MHQTAALAYYSLATTAFSILIGTESKVIHGSIDSPSEWVWLFSVVGLALTMLDALVSIVMFFNIWKNEDLKTAWDDGLKVGKEKTTMSMLRGLGSAGVYLATFMYATRNRYAISPEGHYEHGEGSESIPYLLAATAAVLGAILGDPVNDDDGNLGYYRLGPVRKSVGGAYM